MELQPLLKLLVETESPSHDKAAVDRVGAIVIEEARKLGAEIEIIRNIKTGDHILARWGRGSGGILLMCHMDTVFPLGALEKMPYREADGKIFGPGALDMKAGIVIALGAIARLTKNPALPITLLCTSDEEIGSQTSRKHIERLAKESVMVFVLESALLDGSLKVWRKGGGTLWVKTKGRAAHAGGDHEKGRNAIEEMSHQVIAIQKMTDYSKGTTVSVGTIRGGTVSNVVPEECSVEVDVRVLLPEEWTRIKSSFANLTPVLDGISIETGGGLNRPPMPFDDRIKSAFEKVKTVGEKLGIEIKAGGSGGMSDANFVAPLGIPVIDGMGAVGEGYHSEREFLFADSLEERVKLLAALLAKW
jgi:glutamate carboxypeptidase